MNRLISPAAAVAFTVCGAVPFVAPVVALAAPPSASAPAAMSVAVPTAPQASPHTPFVDEAAGRRLLFAARDYYQAASQKGIDFSVRATLNTSGGPQPSAVTATVTESVFAYSPARRLLVSTETTIPNGMRRIVRKAISDGETLSVTRFDQAGTAPPIREVVRVPVDENTLLPRLLGAAQFAPFSFGAILTANPNTPLSPQSRIAWLQGTQKMPGGTTADIVCENDALIGRPGSQTRRARRYLLDKQTHRFIRFEEWVTRETPPRPARKNTLADDGVRVGYRREEYTYANGETARQKAAYAQNLPPGYEEKPSPDVPASPVAAAPEMADPKAVALLAKWKRSWERFLSYSAQVEVSFGADARTADARPLPDMWKKSGVRYQNVVLRRPDGRARIEQEPLAEANRWTGPRSLLVVSDGQQVRGVVEGGRRGDQTRTVPIDAGQQIWQKINQAGYNERLGVLGGLPYVFLVPLTPESADKMAYNGAATLDDGQAVQVVTLSKTNLNTNAQSGQQTETVTTWRISLGTADGLPRLVEARRVTTTTGRFERDQPPFLMATTRFRRVQVDVEPSSAAFVLPPASR